MEACMVSHDLCAASFQRGASEVKTYFLGSAAAPLGKGTNTKLRKTGD